MWVLYGHACKVKVCVSFPVIHLLYMLCASFPSSTSLLHFIGVESSAQSIEQTLRSSLVYGLLVTTFVASSYKSGWLALPLVDFLSAVSVLFHGTGAEIQITVYYG